MSLFQTQVERQFLSDITTDLTPMYKKFVDYFGNPAIQKNILELIEQQYQGEFIEALFVNILGYIAQPQPNFNLIREKKNETDAKSADAAISINNQITAVIELKDHKTQDLKKVEVQAFGYKNNHKNCHYVVTSNFERLRFYIDNAVDFIEFDLFNLTFDEFRRLWLCLSYESIAKNLPQEIKNQSLSNEDIITKKLYRDYSVFKRLLFDNIVTLNPEHDKLLLFKETQKLLDRFLFLFFAEDKSLLPANSIQGTVDKWKKFNADPMNDYQSLYSRFVKYFKLLDVGYKDANTEIYAYNGGLFANDEFLNKLRIDDTILAENVIKLARYDYDTDVDVNILGRIFENSLNEIEEVTNEITSGVFSSPSGRSGGVSKRKQDGVFYTPRYITQYIVENTVGRLCEEKKTELGIDEDLFEYKRTDKKKQALKVFDAYREWLLQITIVDPACGSGAFLNTALDFLIAEHNWIDNQQDKIAGLKDHFSMGLSNIENTILENNLFGVDINEESVEIAKLSLWLRTAKPHRKLSSLNNNIKCGNSLIDDPDVAGDKAFDWHKEFPQVFGREQKAVEVTPLEKDKTPDYLKLIKEKSAEAQLKAEQGIALSKEALEISKQLAEYANKLEAVSAPNPKYEKLKGGFDVVIGNPPYLRIQGLKEAYPEMTKYYDNTYKAATGNYDIYVLFLERSYQLINRMGLVSFILPHKFLISDFGAGIRQFFSLNKGISELIHFGSELVFKDASTYTCILTISKQPNVGINYRNTIPSNLFDAGQFSKIPYSILNEKQWILNNESDTTVLDKLAKQPKQLKDVFDRFVQGIITGRDAIFCISGNEIGEYIEVISQDKRSFLIEKSILKPHLRGEDISRYKNLFNQEWLIFPYKLQQGKAILFTPKEMQTLFPKAFEYLQQFETELRERENSKFDNEYWYQYSRNQAISVLEQPKIITPEVCYGGSMTLDTHNYYHNSKCHTLLLNETSGYQLKSILPILNSKLFWFYLSNTGNELRGGYIGVKRRVLELFNVPELSESDNEFFIEKSEKMLALYKDLQELSYKFQRMLQRKFELDELPGKLQNWYLLSNKEFIAELGKKKVKLTLAQEAEWEDYFNTEKAKALQIKKQTDDTDREIDRMVYSLYELTEDEIKIVEGEK